MSRFCVVVMMSIVALGGATPSWAGEQERQRSESPRRIGENPFVKDRGRDGERPALSDRFGPGDWELVGRAVVEPKIERQTIEIERQAGRLSRIGVLAQDSDIEIIDLEINYGNEESEKIAVNTLLKAGARSPAYDLNGWERRVRAVTITYRPFGPARIALFGEPQRQLRPGARWEALGCQTVGFLDDKDVIRVGHEDGRFRAIKLTVEGQRLRLARLRVVYANGAVEDLAARTVVPAGTETRPFELTGRRRGIDRIELNYLPQIVLGDGATVCAYGL